MHQWYIGHKKRESEKESKRHRSTKTLKDINVGDSIEQRAKILTTPLVVRQPCQDPKKKRTRKRSRAVTKCNLKIKTPESVK